jgi:hypothetical protein
MFKFWGIEPNLDYAFHYSSIREMLRVSNEVRIFPIVDLNSKRSGYVDRIMHDFIIHKREIRKVNYEFQKGGNEMMIISKDRMTSYQEK